MIVLVLKHVNGEVKFSFFHLRYLSKIKAILSRQELETDIDASKPYAWFIIVRFA